MSFKFVLTKQAEKDLDVFDNSTAKRIIRKLLWFEKQTDILSFAKPLKESTAGDIRFRVGDYRLIAVIKQKQKEIVVVKIGHRKDVYQ